MEANAQNGGIFINGRGQIVEMLKYMNPTERATLLKNIKHRNPALAKELYSESITFETIYSLDEVDMGQIFQFIKAPIFGVALKKAPKAFQRTVLSLAPRAYAEEAYNYLIRDLGSNEVRDIERAQKRVSDTIAALNNRGRITL